VTRRVFVLVRAALLRALPVALAASFAGPGSACSRGSADSKPASDLSAAPALTERRPPRPRDAGVDANVSGLSGKPLYLALCAQCHGADAKGYAADHAPSLVNPTFLESASDDFLRRSILIGRPGTSMAGYGAALGGPLDDAAVDSLVRFLRGLGPERPARADHKPLAPSTRPPGDAAIGAAVYAKNCVGCHGDASTRGEAVSLTNPQLLMMASDTFLRHAIVQGRPGTKMEAFAGRLSDAEIDGVIGYLRALGARNPQTAALLPEPTGKEPMVIHPSGKRPSFTLRSTTCPPGSPQAPPAASSAASSPASPAASTSPLLDATPPCKPDPRFVSVEQVGKAMAAKQRMVIIDARPPSEWRRVHIAGAVSIPYHDLKRLDEVPRDGTWIIAYCACPHHLSGIVVDELRKRGYSNAVVLDEGINEWHRRDLPVVAADGVAKPPLEPSLKRRTFD
jgi:cytochrome c oxidase cbb3-type subunit III